MNGSGLECDERQWAECVEQVAEYSNAVKNHLLFLGFFEAGRGITLCKSAFGSLSVYAV